MTSFDFQHWLYLMRGSVQSLSHVWLFVTPWTTARQASLSITNSLSLPKLMSIKSVMPSSHLIFCRPLLLLPPISPVSSKNQLTLSWAYYGIISWILKVTQTSLCFISKLYIIFPEQNLISEVEAVTTRKSNFKCWVVRFLRNEKMLADNLIKDAKRVHRLWVQNPPLSSVEIFRATGAWSFMPTDVYLSAFDHNEELGTASGFTDDM